MERCRIGEGEVRLACLVLVCLLLSSSVSLLVLIRPASAELVGSPSRAVEQSVKESGSISLAAPVAKPEVNVISLVESFDEPQFETKDGYDIINIEGCGTTSPPGEPTVPAKTIFVLLPPDKDVSDIEVIPARQVPVERELYLYPSQEPVPVEVIPSEGAPQEEQAILQAEPEFTPPNLDIYSSRAPYPSEELYELMFVTSYCGYKLAAIRLLPIQYVPAERSAVFYPELEVQIGLKPASEAELAFRPTSDVKEWVRAHVENPKDIDLYASSPRLDGDAEYLIITCPMFLDALQPLVDLKSQRMSVKVMTLENDSGTITFWIDGFPRTYPGRDTSEMIRNCIIDYYTNEGTKWVLLVGDADNDDLTWLMKDGTWIYGPNYVLDKPWELPVRYVWNPGDTLWDNCQPTDYYYADLDGTWDDDNDNRFGERASDSIVDEVEWFADVYVGRMPAQDTVTMGNIVQKTVNYELDPQRSIDIGLFGANLWSDGDGKTLKQYIKNTYFPLLDNVHEYYVVDDTLGHDSFIDVVNTYDPILINVAGHGNPSLIGYDATSLRYVVDMGMPAQIANKGFTMYAMSCSTNKFDLYINCLGEAMLQDPDGGAIGYIGGARTLWGGSDFLNGGSTGQDVRFFEEVFENGELHQGAALYKSKIDYIGSGWYNDSSLSERANLFVTVLLGDPELSIGLPDIDFKPPSVPTPLEPENGSILLDNTATFRWTSIEDPSGVTYTLQYSTDQSLSPLGWLYRRLVTITAGSSGMPKNYQIKLGIAYDSNMQSDFDDLRFYLTDGSTELNYLIENYNLGEDATVWVRVPFLLGAGASKNIYMYYGNPEATSASDYASTMKYHDYMTASGTSWPARYGHTSVVYDGKMWVIGGSGMDDDYIPYNDVWYSTDGVSWIQNTYSAGWSARSEHTSVVFDNKMWVIGGLDPRYYSFMNDVWYSSDGENWTLAIQNAPWSERFGHTSVVYDNKMWVLGGRGNGVSNNDVWYSSDGENWYQATDNAGWSARFDHTSVVYDNKMWVIGGYDGAYKNDVWYSSDGVNWTQATASAGWSERYGCTSVVYDGKMWVIGGQDCYDRKNSVWHSSDGANWTQATAHAAWTARYGHTSVVFNNKMWVLGGDNGVSDNDVWYMMMRETVTPEPFAIIGEEQSVWAVAIENLAENTYTIPDENALADDIYYWRVWAVDGAGYVSDWSGVLHFTVDITPPPTPAPLSPPPEAIVDSETPIFDWTDVLDVSGVVYTLEIDDDMDFSSQVLIKTYLVASQYQISYWERLADGTYYWRVRAVDGADNPSDWSEVWQFTLLVPPPIPDLIYPRNGTIIHDDTPTFRWTAVDDSSGVTYMLQYSNDPAFQSLVTIESTLENTYTVSGENALTENTYYWMVRAIDGIGNESEWSENWQFIINLTMITHTTTADFKSGTLENLSTVGGKVGLTIEKSNPLLVWSRTYSNLNYNSPEDITVDSFNNICITGETGPVFSYHYFYWSDWLTVKYADNGDNLWARVENFNTFDYAKGIAADSSGNVYVTGWSDTNFSGTTSGCVTVKHDENGNIIWVRTYDNNYSDKGYGVAVDPLGYVYVVGSSSNGGRYYLLLIKYDEGGNEIWARFYDFGFNNEIYDVDIAVDSSGNAYVAGSSPHSALKYFIKKYDGNGEEMWSRNYYIGSSTAHVDIAVDSNNDVYSTTTLSDYYTEYFTMKHDSDGNLLWGRTYYSQWSQYTSMSASGIAVDPLGYVYVTGTAADPYSKNYATLEYDSDGNFIWDDVCETEGVNGAAGIAASLDYKLYVTGSIKLGGNQDYHAIQYQYQVSYYPLSGVLTSADLISSSKPIIGATATWNADVPDGTSLKVELSNDGGSTWYQVDNGVKTDFPELGSVLRYRLTFSTTDNTKTPVLYDITLYNDNTPPPAPTLISPRNGVLIGDNTPTFRWTAVEDPSGVTYTLQYSRSDNFQEDINGDLDHDGDVDYDDYQIFLAAYGHSIGDPAYNPEADYDGTGTVGQGDYLIWRGYYWDFIETVTVIENLLDNTYTVPSENALPNGRYYWRVRAIDGASNLSDWSDVWRFRVIKRVLIQVENAIPLLKVT